MLQMVCRKSVWTCSRKTGGQLSCIEQVLLVAQQWKAVALEPEACLVNHSFICNACAGSCFCCSTAHSLEETGRSRRSGNGAANACPQCLAAPRRWPPRSRAGELWGSASIRQLGTSCLASNKTAIFSQPGHHQSLFASSCFTCSHVIACSSSQGFQGSVKESSSTRAPGRLREAAWRTLRCSIIK